MAMFSGLNSAVLEALKKSGYNIPTKGGAGAGLSGAGAGGGKTGGGTGKVPAYVAPNSRPYAKASWGRSLPKSKKTNFGSFGRRTTGGMTANALRGVVGRGAPSVGYKSGGGLFGGNRPTQRYGGGMFGGGTPTPQRIMGPPAMRAPSRPAGSGFSGLGTGRVATGKPSVMR